MDDEVLPPEVSEEEVFNIEDFIKETDKLVSEMDIVHKIINSQIQLSHKFLFGTPTQRGSGIVDEILIKISGPSYRQLEISPEIKRCFDEVKRIMVSYEQQNILYVGREKEKGFIPILIELISKAINQINLLTKQNETLKKEVEQLNDKLKNTYLTTGKDNEPTNKEKAIMFIYEKEGVTHKQLELLLHKNANYIDALLHKSKPFIIKKGKLYGLTAEKRKEIELTQSLISKKEKSLNKLEESIKE